MKWFLLSTVLFFLLVLPARAQVLVPGDANGDGIVNTADLKHVLLNWLAIASGPLDQNADGKINSLDFAFVVSFLPPPPTPSPTPTPAPVTSFIFTAAGDYGASSYTTNVLTGIANSGSKFNLALGDMSYNELTPETKWCEFVKDTLNQAVSKPKGDAFGENYPFLLVSGNHENNGFNGYINNFKLCLPAPASFNISPTSGYAKEYYFDYQNARFIMISPNLNLDGETYTYSSGPRRTWLVSAIDSAPVNIKWIIVGMHKNCLSVGQKSCDIGSSLLNLLLTKKVDLVLQGHDHNYQRSKQLALNTSTCTGISPGSFNANCVVASRLDGSYFAGAGPVIIIAGTGGKGLYTTSSSDSEAGYFAKWSSSSRGYLKVSVSASALNVNFLPISGTFAGDSFIIN